MTRLTSIIAGALLLLALSTITGLAVQDKEKPADTSKVETPAITLTDKQRAEWDQFATSEGQLQQARNEIVGQAPNISVTPLSSMEFLAALQKVMSSLEIVRARRGQWLAEVRLEHGCKECVIEDGKLVKK